MGWNMVLSPNLEKRGKSHGLGWEMCRLRRIGNYFGQLALALRGKMLIRKLPVSLRDGRPEGKTRRRGALAVLERDVLAQDCRQPGRRSLVYSRKVSRMYFT